METSQTGIAIFLFVYMCVDETQHVEIDQMLRSILEFEEQFQSPRSDLSVLLVHSLAMLWLLCNDYTKVNKNIIRMY